MPRLLMITLLMTRSHSVRLDAHRPAVAAVAAAALLSVTVAGCGDASGSSSTSGGLRTGARLAVVATTTQVADFARQVGGDMISLTQILRPNVDPHDYEASPADVQAIASADLVVKNGVGLEAFLADALTAAAFNGTVVDTSAGVQVRTGSGDEQGKGDPHIWHNPRNAMIMAHNIAAAFAARDPAHQASYQANYAAYARQLVALDTDIQRKIDSLPADQRKLVTNHDSLGYYVDRYHLQFVGSIIPSFDTAAELSGKDIEMLVAKIRNANVRAIFSESSLPAKTAETIGSEAGVRVVAGAGALYTDTLGPAGSDAATYLQMEEHNTDTIVRALGG